MAESPTVTVLLADSDALRRDGLASVLAANSDMEIVASCPDGDTALAEIRDQRPSVAVVDLNLPGLHGIELVRRVRGEGLGTKMVIVAGTSDDEIVREVVRSGADAYLLKNGPARHLTDAIHYVLDGGQYFSPQLNRDGRDRHLLEEPRRAPVDRDYREELPPRRESERQRRGSRPIRHTADPDRFRERIREEGSRDLRDRDYDIMAEMADGIRPILDRLDEIENRVVEMEEGEQPLPASPRSWLSEQLSETLGGGRAGGRGAGRGSVDIEARLPELIEQAVSKRFQSMAGKLQEEIEEQHVRTLETFVKNIQVKLVQRVSALEQNMNQQAQAMHELREYNQRTEDNLGRLISGVDKLASELPKRLAAAQAAETSEPVRKEPVSARESSGRSGREPRRSSSLSGRSKLLPLIFWVAIAVAAIAGGGYWILSRGSKDTATVPPPGKEIQTANARAAAEAAAPKAVPPAASADTATKLTAARQYMDRKEYSTAEDIYKQILETDDKNEDALKGLASALYREDKIEESTAVLDRLPKH